MTCQTPLKRRGFSRFWGLEVVPHTAAYRLKKRRLSSVSPYTVADDGKQKKKTQKRC